MVGLGGATRGVAAILCDGRDLPSSLFLID